MPLKVKRYWLNGRDNVGSNQSFGCVPRALMNHPQAQAKLYIKTCPYPVKVIVHSL